MYGLILFIEVVENKVVCINLEYVGFIKEVINRKLIKLVEVIIDVVLEIEEFVLVMVGVVID